MSMSRESSALVVIYGPYLNDEDKNGHEVISIFNERGLIDESTLEDFYKELVGSEPKVIESGHIGYFSQMEEIQKFAFRICQKLGNEAVSLVSVEDYNSALIDSFKSEDLLLKLQNIGNQIPNPDAGKGGFFSKLFN